MIPKRTKDLGCLLPTDAQVGLSGNAEHWYILEKNMQIQRQRKLLQKGPGFVQEAAGQPYD